MKNGFDVYDKELLRQLATTITSPVTRSDNANSYIITVGKHSSIIVPANPDRIRLIITPLQDNIWIDYGQAADRNNDLMIRRGSYWEEEIFTGDVYAICGRNNRKVKVIEILK